MRSVQSFSCLVSNGFNIGYIQKPKIVRLKNESLGIKSPLGISSTINVNGTKRIFFLQMRTIDVLQKKRQFYLHIDIDRRSI